jgi:hypothetical protein
VSRNQTHELTKLVEKNRETDPILQPCANPSLISVGNLFVAGQDVVGVAVNAMAVSPGDKESAAFLRESSWWVGRGAGRKS